jgi:Flp pilus assembly protein TadG
VRDEDGQAAVEFVLVLPLLVTVITAVVQFGALYQHYVSLTDAVRSGARVAAVSRQAANPTGTATAAVIAAGSGLSLTASQVQVLSAWQVGTNVSVTATYPYSLSIFGFPVKTGSLSSTTTERVE